MSVELPPHKLQFFHHSFCSMQPHRSKTNTLVISIVDLQVDMCIFPSISFRERLGGCDSKVVKAFGIDLFSCKRLYQSSACSLLLEPVSKMTQELYGPKSASCKLNLGNRCIADLSSNTNIFFYFRVSLIFQRQSYRYLNLKYI